MLTKKDPRITLNTRKACIPCRRKKRRCDADKPACGLCVRIEQSNRCTYESEHHAERVLLARAEGERAGTGSAGKANIPLMLHQSGGSPARAGPGPLEGPSSLRDPFLTLLKEKDMLTNIRDPLVAVFLRHRWLYFTQWNMSRFWAAYSLPPHHPEGIHPALLDAMCLFGCLQNHDSLRPYEQLFYARLQRSLYDCLAHADRLLDFVRASMLAANYCYLKGRIVEGQSRASATVRFATACGLNQIDTYNYVTSNMTPLLQPPKDLVNLGDMIHAWWGLFCIDRIGALLLEIPATVSHGDKATTTMWPCALEFYTDVREIELHAL
ncbi:hypothetical protein BOTBODRAFT_389059 [Botryobasidium botryosum FD-172 SS1]|uniref:Zn(2)-C6 fungal-type domain-containing protein n=1 Tax=Botryobasidium botryosum (strain FD-172 SS1) TaxID=930990 RepID=A0A067MX30_BOTB1|nr:hypothetical protein BOTBODRAFT_389059 [Botryobasidium botryosum FD-172 SS1]